MTFIRTHKVFSLLAFLSIPVCGCLGGHAQQPSPAPAAAAKTSGYTVTLPVTVRDKKGELVTSLNKSDLTLTEDGRPQTIQSLSHDADVPFRIGLLVDTARNMSGARAAERKAAQDFVDQVLPAAGDSKNQMFLIHFDREVELLEDFTNARDKLHQELEDMGPTSQAHNEDQGPETSDNPNTAPRRRGGEQLYDAIYLAADELMKGKSGRKVLVVFSDGADHGSKETMNDAVDAADRANLAVYTIFFKGEREESYGRSGFPGGGRRGGMGGGYPGGGGGWPGSGGGGRRQPEPTSATGVDGKKIMQEIAARTGGHAYEAKKAQDLGPIYKLIDEELHGQYWVTYVPDKPDTDGGFHKTAITAENKDLTVVTREGYYAPEGK